MLAGFLLLAGVFWSVLPSLGRGTFRVDGGPPQSLDLPLTVHEEVGRVEITVPLDVPLVLPRRVLLKPDDCIENLAVNGAVVNDPSARFCDYENGRTLDLSPWLHTGRNELRVTVKNNGGPSGLDVDLRQDPLFGVLGVALVGVAALGAARILALFRAGREQTALLLVLLGGSVLRVLYVLRTPTSVRGYDSAGHLEYIRYVAEHWTLPPAHGGWEFYQPPLYYLLTAPLVRFDALRGATKLGTLFHLQAVSVVLSVVTLGVALWVVQMLFAPSQRKEMVLCGGLLSVFPGLLFFAPRINNDVVVQLTGFVSIALLVRFWKKGRTGDWVALSACIGLGMLAKTNALVLLPLALLSLLFRPELERRKKVWLGALSTGIVALVCGWFVVPRFLEERRTAAFLVGNTDSLEAALRVPNSFEAFFGFHPLDMLEHPYNKTWDDSAGRKFVWEFFARSSLFGEFDFGPKQLLVCRLSLVLLALLTMVGLFGWWRSLRRGPRKDLPLHLLVVLSLASQAAFRFVSPFSCSQDFRYSFLLTLPFAFFVTLGSSAGPKWLRWGSVALWASFVVSSAVFLSSVSVT